MLRLRAFFAGITLFAVLAPAVASERLHIASDLDRVAYAVDGAESSHGKDGAMWRPNPSGPQGPMQVSEKAAIDAGGGNRFDVGENRYLGRQYLALLFRRYQNWPDAISAYNWGLGNLDTWIRAGRAPEKMLPGVSRYLHRVMQDSGICNRDAQARAVCEATGSSTPAAAAVRRFPVASRTLAKAMALAVRFGAEH